ncbi:amidohydrolase family protein [Helicobacter sp. 11S03491-1]|uniref:amidohydrolase family protein n=1 Tax=Helicobacter sp. 11S03491-1 TaxID=1476196 RepID=UPI0015DB21FD|nr:amidohydrolase family protein [Helicobacter sp. 11S03491-1]
MKIIDSHFHIWDLSILRLAWLENFPSLNHNYFIQNYLDEYKNNDLEGAVYIEVDSHRDDKNKENEYVLKLNDKKIKAMIIGDKLQASMLIPENHLLKGIREVLHTPDAKKGRCLEDDFKAGLQILGQKGLVFEACMRTQELEDMYECAKESPKTRIILNHLGNPNLDVNYLKSLEFQRYQKSICLLAKLPNVVCKISGVDFSKVSLRDFKYLLYFCIDAFGEDRVMYGSNFPVCNLYTNVTQWISIILECLKMKHERIKQKLFYENAKTFYQL